MKINDGRITFLVGNESTTIEIFDADANIIFAKIKLTNEQFVQALSRLANTECDLEVFGLKNVGKKREKRDLIFKVSDTVIYQNRIEKAKSLVKSFCPEGWEPAMYFGSQSSFFVKDKKLFAKTYMYRWVDYEK